MAVRPLIVAFALAPVVTQASPLAAWQSLGLGMAFQTSERHPHCEVTSFSESPSPRAEWNFDAPRKLAGGESISRAEGFSSQLSEAVLRFVYGVTIVAGDVRATHVLCEFGQVSSIEVGRFSYLVINVHFSHEKLARYFERSFEPSSLSAVELLSVVASLAHVLPGGIRVEQVLVSDLPESALAQGEVKASVLRCNFGELSACEAAAMHFEQHLVSTPAVASLVNAFKSFPPASDVSVVGRKIEADGVALRQLARALEFLSLVERRSRDLLQSGDVHLRANVEDVQSKAAAIRRQFDAEPLRERDVNGIVQVLERILLRLSELETRDKAFKKCQELEQVSPATLDDLLRGGIHRDCVGTTEALAKLTSFDFEKHTLRVATDGALLPNINSVALFAMNNDEEELQRAFISRHPRLEKIVVKRFEDATFLKVLENSGYSVVKGNEGEHD